MGERLSRRVEIRRLVINQLIGPTMRLIDQVLDAYVDQNRRAIDEARDVTRLIVLALASRSWGDNLVLIDPGLLDSVKDDSFLTPE